MEKRFDDDGVMTPDLTYDGAFMPELSYEDEVLTPELSYDDGALPAFLKGSSADEALIDCVNRCGGVDMRYMSEISGLSVEKLITELRGSAMFQDPGVFRGEKKWSLEKGWLLAPRYLSGNIPGKLASAIEAEARFPGCFTANVEALKRLAPAELGIEDIHISLGASWIPVWIYEEFIAYLLNLKYAPTVRFNKELSSWRVEPASKTELEESFANRYTYGTMDMTAIRIIEQTMNARTVKIYDHVVVDEHGNQDKVLNQERTLAVQEKQRAIIREFESWAPDDEFRRSKLLEAYNDTYVGYTFSPYDGSFLKLPGLNPDVRLYPHQRNAIARILLSNSNVLLAHDVGTGKTYEMIVSAHELKRMGLSRKNMIVVPNNVLQATVDAHRMLYPDDDIFVVYPDDFSPDSRNAVLEKIRSGDYVCIYTAYSSFNLMVLSRSFWIDKMKDEIAGLFTAAQNCSVKHEKKALESEAKKKQKKLSTYCLETEETPFIPYEKLGITTLFVDEAHNYKNIRIVSRTDNIVGMNSSKSKKCDEMFEKCRIAERVIFSTGTPLTNSLADLFVIQSYLQPEELKFRGIDNFDMWINTFGERETNFEIDVTANDIRPITRFSTFHNLFELMSLFSTVCDFHPNQPKDEDLPAFDGFEDVCVPKSEAQAKYIRCLTERTEAIRAHKVKRNEDNLLKITTDGRKCALDIRLVDLTDTEIEVTAEDLVNDKIAACAKKVYELYVKYPGTCQVVFSDLGTPKPGFNVYDELKSLMTDLGIPECEIAFVHDATTDKARSRLFDQMNGGLLRVVIGSTQKLGVGVNVQERLIALHHLSVPWRPADMVQREGRIIRRGNTCEKVFIYHYVTEGSFDSYSWQLLENKQRFISSFLSGTSEKRDNEDIADVVLTYAEIKALAIGNPLIKKRVETANKLERTRLSVRQRQKQLIDIRAVIDSVPEIIAEATERRDKAARDAAYYAENRHSVPTEERRAFGEELLDALKDNRMRETERVFDSYQGFDVVLPANMMSEEPYVYVEREGGGRYYVAMDGDKALGCAMRIDNLLDDLSNRVEGFDEQIAAAEKNRVEAIADLELGNPYQDMAAQLAAELEAIDRELAGGNES